MLSHLFKRTFRVPSWKEARLECQISGLQTYGLPYVRFVENPPSVCVLGSLTAKSWGLSALALHLQRHSFAPFRNSFRELDSPYYEVNMLSHHAVAEIATSLSSLLSPDSKILTNPEDEEFK